jgi:hypothetical protein
MEWIVLILLVLIFPGVAVALLRGTVAVARVLVVLCLVGLAVAIVWLMLN